MSDFAEKTRILKLEAVMDGYSAVSRLYPHLPSMSIWRAWEYAAYKRYVLTEPILDVGCGDGQYFRLVWPGIRDVTGVDISPWALDAAKQSGVYSAVHNTSALDMAFESESFSSAFANCSLEHMDHIEDVFRNIWRVLRPGGEFLLSVTTDKFVEWGLLPLIVEAMDGPDRAAEVRAHYKDYHHLVSACPPEVWSELLESTGFTVIDHVPIVPELLGRINLLIDNLWHVPLSNGEAGGILEPYFERLNNFPEEFGNIVRSLMVMDKNWHVGSGAVFFVRKAKGSAGK